MITENPYVKQYPEMMAGKTVLYCHGFASSGQSGTVERLRTVMPRAKVIAPDLPVHPEEAVALLHDICDREKPDLIIGTSMGGMYAEQLYGFDRICVNPALEMGETMRAHGMTGTQQFQNPRLDGVQEFYVDKALVKEYKEQSEKRFEGVLPNTQHPSPDTQELQRVWGLFGDEDTTVDTYDMFRAVYPQALHFHGEHRMNDKSFMHSVVPVIRWIDDRQEGRERPIIYIGVETLTDSWQKPASSVQKAVRLLIEHYQVYFVGPETGRWEQWLEEHINVPAWHHTIYTYRRDLLYGDYLISQQHEGDTMATLLEFGSDTFKTWEDIIDYFSRLGGQ
ncbi:MAG: esterase [Prevotella sp.]|nr:esterase [Prevotella sp.]